MPAAPIDTSSHRQSALRPDAGDVPRRSSRPAVDRQFSLAVRNAMVGLRGRSLGECSDCCRPVFDGDSFTRCEGSVIHVHCMTSAARSSSDSSDVRKGHGRAGEPPRVRVVRFAGRPSSATVAAADGVG